jgi:hypothetical protein
LHRKKLGRIDVKLWGTRKPGSVRSEQYRRNIRENPHRIGTLLTMAAEGSAALTLRDCNQ